MGNPYAKIDQAHRPKERDLDGKYLPNKDIVKRITLQSGPAQVIKILNKELHAIEEEFNKEGKVDLDRLEKATKIIEMASRAAQAYQDMAKKKIENRLTRRATGSEDE